MEASRSDKITPARSAALAAPAADPINAALAEWRAWRRRRAVLRDIAFLRRFGAALTQNEVIELLRREAKR